MQLDQGLKSVIGGLAITSDFPCNLKINLQFLFIYFWKLPSKKLTKFTNCKTSHHYWFCLVTLILVCGAGRPLKSDLVWFDTENSNPWLHLSAVIMLQFLDWNCKVLDCLWKNRYKKVQILDFTCQAMMLHHVTVSWLKLQSSGLSMLNFKRSFKSLISLVKLRRFNLSQFLHWSYKILDIKAGLSDLAWLY